MLNVKKCVAAPHYHHIRKMYKKGVMDGTVHYWCKPPIYIWQVLRLGGQVYCILKPGTVYQSRKPLETCSLVQNDPNLILYQKIMGLGDLSMTLTIILRDLSEKRGKIDKKRVLKFAEAPLNRSHMLVSTCNKAHLVSLQHWGSS